MKAFPSVTVTAGVSAPEALSAQDFEVTENGTAVGDLEVAPVDVAAANIDVVLVVDNSATMEVGTRLEAAVAAARSFLETVPPRIRTGLVTFNAVPTVRAELGADRSEALAALETLTTATGTTLFDAVDVAAGLFREPGQRTIIVLSDGVDTLSEGSLASAVAAAESANAAIFTVGLEARRAGTATLTSLAQRTGGRYASSVTDDLLDVYRGLAAEVSNQYRLTYRSQAAPGTGLTITVRAAGVEDSAVVAAPAAAAPVPEIEPDSGGPLPAGVAFAIAIGLSFLAAFALVVSVAGGMIGARRDRLLAQRMAVPRPGAQAAPEDEGPPPGWMPDSLVQVGERLTGSGGLRAALDRALERAAVSVRPGEFMAGTLLLALVGGLIGGALFRSVLLAVALVVLLGSIPSVLLWRAVSNRMEAFNEQLPDILMVLGSSLRAGHSFLQALDLVAKEIPEPGGQELARVLTEIRLGRPVEDALLAWADRMDSENLNWAVMAVNIQRDVGGNLAELLETVAETVRDRETLRRQIRALTADGRLSMIILVALPFLIALYLSQVNPDYLGILFSRFLGQILLGGGAVLMLLGILWMRKIVNIDV